jgi:uncharacterized protein YndB with AHSA1/START domain
VTVAGAETWLRVSREIEASTQEVWDVISTAGFRGLWHHASRMELSDGRTGPGTEYRCFSGQTVRIDRIVEWQPFRQMTLDCEWALGARVRVTFDLASSERGTRIEARLGRPAANGNLFRPFVTAAHVLRRSRIEQECEANLAWLARTIEAQRNGPTRPQTHVAERG